MAYKSLKDCVKDLKKEKELITIDEIVDAKLEMAAIHRRVFAAAGPALYFAQVKNSSFPAVSNLFGSEKRWRFIFRNEFKLVQKAIEMKAKPEKFFFEFRRNFFKTPKTYLKLPFTGLSSLPKKISSSKAPILENKTSITQLPQLISWPKDGGPFITLPQVFSLDPDHKKNLLKSNLGMYRIQLAGNDYETNKEIGLHYQIHRGLGIHHTKALARGEDLPVSIFVGGPPAHSLAAVMPLPETMSELIIAGMMGGRRFRYCKVGQHILSSDADFCITGWIRGKKTKREGPFGDHLGYYSLTHDFPVLEVENVYHRTDAIWPFTVVGRPPQEDSYFGKMIHELTSPMVPSELPGVHEVHAVDASGVHPLLLAIGSERYLPYKEREPAEIITQAHSILGFNQCSLAKYLLITAKQDKPELRCQNVKDFFTHILERVDWRKDLHFQSKTSMDTLDYSGERLNFGSKVIIAVCGEIKRQVTNQVPENLHLSSNFSKPRIVIPGIMVLQANAFKSYMDAKKEISDLCQVLERQNLDKLPMIVLVDKSDFCSNNFNNFLWLTFTRSNPSHDIYGVKSFTYFKHWGCEKSLIIDARIKPHHAPVLEEDKKTKERVDEIFRKNKDLRKLDN